MQGRPEIPLAVALAPLVTLVACFAGGALTFGLSNEILISSMLAAASVAGLIALRRGATWGDIEHSTGTKLAAVLPVILILLAIGMLIGTWVASGTIPLLVKLGLELVEPRWFVVTAFLSTAAMSLATGTSWGSAGTLGVALMGAATAVGSPLPATAGAVVSGAYFGDKLSALSDSTNICALGAGANLYAHIRHLLYTSLPSFLVALAVFAWAGGATEAAPAGAVELATEIESTFVTSPWALMPMALVLLGVAARRPPALVLAGASVVAMVLGIAVQGFGLDQVLAAAVSGFDPQMLASRNIDPAAVSPLLETLVDRGGLYSMANTLIVVIAAFVLAAAMDVSGALARILGALLGVVRSTFGLIVSTLAAGMTMISLTSHAGVTALIVGEMFQPAYRDRGLAPENLSRSLEDSVTVVEALMPWTVSGIFMATTLGVPTVEYAPWAAFCYGGPLFSLLVAFGSRFGSFGIKPSSPQALEREGSLT